MPLTVEQFSQQLTSSGVMSADDLQKWLSSLSIESRPGDGEAMARELVAQKRLTAWQAKAIYGGEGASLILGNYLILDKLGQGGMGMVLKAEHKRMKRVVAIKVLSPAVIKDEQALRRFHREVEAAAKLEHPNIVAAYDADEAKGTHFLAMQYVNGTDLSAFVKKHGPLPVDRAVNCILQAARGLEYAHRRGVIHRDIKPANLLIDQEGTVKILDMGLARIDDSVGSNSDGAGLTSTGTIMGTVDYMSPEQAMDSKSADARSDIYSLGCTLYYLLTGKAMYTGDTIMKRLIAHRESPIPVIEGISDDPSRLTQTRDSRLASLNSLLSRMVAKRPGDRFQSMTAVVAELERCWPRELSSVETATVTFVQSTTTADEDDATRLGDAMISQLSANSTSNLSQPVTTDRVAGVPSTSVRTETPMRSSRAVVFLGIMLAVLAFVVVLPMIVNRQRDDSTDAKPGVPGAVVTIDFDVERQVAERLLKLNKGKTYLANDKTDWVLASPLPPEPFHVHDVGFVQSDVTDEDIALLAGCRGLKKLDLRLNPRVTAAGLKTLGLQPKLETLFLDDTSCARESLQFLTNYPRLKVFSISGECPEGLFQSLPSCPELTTLMTPYRPGCVGDKGMETIAQQCPNLRELVISDDRPHTLAPLSQLRMLQQLHCYGSQLSEEAMVALAGLPEFQSLGIELPTPSCMSRLDKIGPRIRKLSLRNQAGLGPESLTDRTDWQRINSLAELQELTIMGMISVDAGLLRDVAALPQLKAFHVYGELPPEFHSKLRRYTADDIAMFRQMRPDVELHINGQEYPALR
ncbi:MAG: protein kinase [Planctomycetaceae bacterium]